MTLYDLGPTRPTYRPTAPPVHVRMDGDHVVITATGPLDRDATNALAASLDAVVTTGKVAVLDLYPYDGPTSTPLGAAPSCIRSPARCPGADASVEAVGPGLIRVRTGAGPWTIDVPMRRLYVGHDEIERRFVPAIAWVDARSVTFTPRAVGAVVTDGYPTSSNRVPGTQVRPGR